MHGNEPHETDPEPAGPTVPEPPEPIDGQRIVEESIERSRTAATEWGHGWIPGEKGSEER
jgi:hypothetical protein